MTPDEIRKMADLCGIVYQPSRESVALRALADVYDEAQHWRHNMNKHGEADLQPLMDALRRVEALKP